MFGTGNPLGYSSKRVEGKIIAINVILKYVITVHIVLCWFIN